MALFRTEHDATNVNVTLDELGGDLGTFSFPCPLCGAGLSILNTKRNKPYCTCNDCGLQMFVRGKNGIARMERMAQQGVLISVKGHSAGYGISLLNRVDQLKSQKHNLEQKQGIVFTDKNVENAISLVDAEIENVQRELAKLSKAKQTDDQS